MLLEKRRKRARGAIGVFPAAVRHTSRGALSGADSAVAERRGPRSPAPDSASAATATSLTVPSPSDLGTPASLAPSSSLSSSVVSSSPPRNRAIDRRVLFARASRMQALVLDRLRSLDVRHGRRCELLEEILRLKKVMQELQEEVDATTRTVESMERLVLHLSRLSMGNPTPSRTIENIPRIEALRRMDDVLRSQVSVSRAISIKDHRNEDHEVGEERRNAEDSSGGDAPWES